ncbi:MAG: PQQ-binding-like beta-propeller repeat protein [Planctomycetota bacterium]
MTSQTAVRGGQCEVISARWRRLLPRLATASLLAAAAVTLGLDRAAAVSTAAEPTGTVATWPQWRGPQRDGQISGQPAWPDQIGDSALVKNWSVPLAPSYSGPIVSEDQVFVTETKEKKIEVIRALDRKTGKQNWEVSWEGAISVPFFAKANGDWIRATPAYDGQTLYVGGIKDLLVAIDGKSGQVKWKIDFPQELKSSLPTFGFVSSPLVVGDALFVQAGGGCVRVDKATGKVIWQSLKDGGGMMGSAFSSPFLATIAGREQLLVQTRERLAGVDPQSGTELWSREIPAFRGMNILTPTVYNGNIFTSSYGGKSFMISVANENGTFATKEAWTNKVTGYMSTPVVINGHAYLHLQNQRFTCINLATGETCWTTTPFGKYWSLVANGDKILALDERGELLLIKANPEKFEKLDSRKLGSDDTWAHLAVCGNEIFIRELNAMTAYSWKAASTTNAQAAR